jgi:hypothetical protein
MNRKKIVQAIAAAISALLGALAVVLCIYWLFDPAWIEQWFGVDPDAGSGSLEALIITCLSLATVAFGSIAVMWGRQPVRELVRRFAA